MGIRYNRVTETYVPVKGNFSYLSLITDAYSRKVVGWAMEDRLEAEGPMKALKMAPMEWL